MLRKALATLPATLDQTYERILCAITEEESKYALRILRWLAFSIEPLSLNEVAEAVAIDITRDPAFDRDEVLEDPLDALGICSSLVTIATVTMYKQGIYDDVQTIALAHYSVQEYLLSDRIKHGQAKQYSLRKFDCHESITRACLKYLLQFNQSQMLSKDFFDNNALAMYSARYWASHLQETDEQVEETIRIAVDLLTLDKPAFLIWSQLYDADDVRKEPDFRLELVDTLIPLYCAARYGLSKVSTQLLNAGADVNAQCGVFGSALGAASLLGHEETVKLLLDAGAHGNAQCGGSGSVLAAVSFRGYEEIVKLLLNAGADVNFQCGKFESALGAASSRGHEKTVKLLLDAGANGKDGDISDPLQRACEGEHWDIICMLLNTGAHFHDGCLSRVLEAVARAGRKTIVEMLLSACVNQPVRDMSGAIELAARGGHKEIVEMLLSASVNHQERDLSGAIQQAAVDGHVQLVKMLLSAGASILSDSKSLSWACHRGNEQLVMILLDAGATGWDGDFIIEIQIAEENGHKRILEMLCYARTKWSDSRSIEAAKVSSEEEVIGAASRVTTKRKRS
jgi:ankyrin repeat protein